MKIYPKTTQALNLYADYQDWHKGRAYFAVWYLDVSQHIELKEYCLAMQQQLSSFLHEGYQRQWHITLFVDGFWVEHAVFDDDFAWQMLSVQIQALKKLELKPFSLYTAGLATFLGSPYIKIGMTETLEQIRQCLAQTKCEIAPLYYIPHITLGFYRQVYSYQYIIEKLAEIDSPTIKIDIDTLSFGIYRTTELQGKLYTVQQLKLGDVSRETF